MPYTCFLSLQSQHALAGDKDKSMLDVFSSLLSLKAAVKRASNQTAATQPTKHAEKIAMPACCLPWKKQMSANSAAAMTGRPAQQVQGAVARIIVRRQNNPETLNE